MRVVYLTHNGAGTALVRSQVLPYLRRLAALGVDLRLVTFERDGTATAPLGFHWRPIRAMAGGGLLAKALDIVTGFAVTIGLLARGGRLVHARSYVPAAIAWAARLVLRRPYLFDMRGFLPEEYVEGGHWREGELRHRVLVFAERVLLRDAAAIVTLTHRGAKRLRTEARYARAVGTKPIAVIPCAVDLERFAPATGRPGAPTLLYAGSVGMWYELDAMLRVFALARHEIPSLRFLILNVGQHALISERVAAHGLGTSVDLGSGTYEEMPTLIGRAHVGICLLRQASSKLGSSPIKVAEYLACGLPVIVNRGQGDTDALVTEHGAGHVLADYSDEELIRAAGALRELLADPGAGLRARALAESEYSADRAAEIYLRLYREIDAAGGGGDPRAR